MNRDPAWPSVDTSRGFPGVGGTKRRDLDGRAQCKVAPTAQVRACTFKGADPPCEPLVETRTRAGEEWTSGPGGTSTPSQQHRRAGGLGAMGEQTKETATFSFHCCCGFLCLFRKI